MCSHDFGHSAEAAPPDHEQPCSEHFQEVAVCCTNIHMCASSHTSFHRSENNHYVYLSTIQSLCTRHSDAVVLTKEECNWRGAYWATECDGMKDTTVFCFVVALICVHTFHSNVSRVCACISCDMSYNVVCNSC